MCGLYGFITSENKNDSLLTESQKLQKHRILEGLMVCNASRGTDSTGIATLIKSNEKTIWKLLKDTEPSTTFVGNNELQELLRHNPQVVLGHTRFATTGAVTPRNAHPFKWGKIIGTHNGMVSNHAEIDNKVDVDSEVIFKLLNKHNNKFNKVFKRLSGQFAIVWTNLEEENVVYLVREDNPLSVAVVPSLKTLFWTSEAIHLVGILTAVLGGTAKYQIFTPKKEVVYRIDSKLQVIKTPVKFKETTNYTSYGYKGIYDDDGYYESNKDWKKYTTETETIDGEKLDEENALNLAQEYGCEKCGEIPETTFWYDKDNYYVVCPNCKHSKEFRNTKLEKVDYLKMPMLESGK
jgi:glucosamine 6-phosphate synthetase-like amidotransferase/phosphosugar isomerase protein/rubredoxin